MRELLEDGDLVGARGLQVLGEHGPAGVVQGAALAGHDAFAVLRDGVLGVDTRDGEVLHVGLQGLRQVGGRVRRGQEHLVSAVRELEGHGGGHGGLAHPALAHAHDQRRAVRLDVVDEGTQVGEAVRHGRRGGWSGVGEGRWGGVEERAQRGEPDGVERQQRDRGAGQRAQVGRRRAASRR